MEPEEIDKLFRDKLAGRAAMPSPDAWMRLQQKMEPPKKERTMWIYYAAASVVLLLVCGILYFKNGLDPTGPAVATVPRVASPAPVSQPGTPAENTRETDRQTTPVLAQAPASTPAAPEVRRKTADLPVKSRRLKPGGSPTPNDPLPALAATPRVAPAENPAQAATPPPAPAAHQSTLAAAAPDLRVVEVVVKRDTETNTGESLPLRENLNRKGHLLKNIYQQARNLKNGEPVELAALGVDKSRIQEETKELKQKITNVISL
jgi:hypothetical protein